MAGTADGTDGGGGASCASGSTGGTSSESSGGSGGGEVSCSWAFATVLCGGFWHKSGGASTSGSGGSAGLTSWFALGVCEGGGGIEIS